MKTRAEDPILPLVYITKYALTKGIYTAVNVRHGVSISERMVAISQHGAVGNTCVHKPYWHTTKEDAYNQVQRMLNAKCKSLAKEQAKLDALQVQLTRESLPETPWEQ